MMTRLQLSLLLAAFCITAIAAAPPATQDAGGLIFEETFKGELKPDWVWLREDKPAWRIEAGSLHVKVGPGSLWDQSNSAKNVLLVAVPSADVSAEVSVTSRPQDQAEQATLLYYADEDNYVKLCKEWMTGKQNVVLAREEKGKGQFVAGKPSDGETLRLRLTRRGAEVIGEYSTDVGKEWVEVGKCAAPVGSEMKIGLVAHGANAGEAREAAFKNFRITKAK